MQKDFIINKIVKEITSEVNDIKHKDRTYEITEEEVFEMIDSQWRALRYLMYSGVSEIHLTSFGKFSVIKKNADRVTESNKLDIKVKDI